MIFVISGCPGAGKSTLSRAVLERVERGIHLPVDDLRGFVVRGHAHPVPVWTAAATEQFALARRGAARLARDYAAAGFAVVIDDVITPEEVRTIIEPELRDIPVTYIMLDPTTEVAQDRNARRTGKGFEPGVLVDAIERLGPEMHAAGHAAKAWRVIDNSHMDPETTADMVWLAAVRTAALR